MDAVTADFAPVAQVRMRKVRHLHFVGIGGAGMSGIAEVLHTLGFVVSGSDMNESPAVRHLRGLGIEVFIGHATENLAGADVLVVSTAIAADNPELVAAHERRMPVVRRAEMLAPHASSASRRDAGRDHALSDWARGGWHPRQDYHHLAVGRDHGRGGA